MADYVTEISEEYLEHAEYNYIDFLIILIKFQIFSAFEKLAIRVLDKFLEKNSDAVRSLLLKKTLYFDLNILEMAQIGRCKEFAAHSAVQNLLTSIWIGHSKYYESFNKNFKV